MQRSGSRTRPSFSKAATTTYLPAGTPSIVNAVDTSPARRPGTVTPRPVAGSYVDSMNSTTDVVDAPPPLTIDAEPLTALATSAPSFRSTLTVAAATSAVA